MSLSSCAADESRDAHPTESKPDIGERPGERSSFPSSAGHLFFEYLVVVSLKKNAKGDYEPKITYQFPKVRYPPWFFCQMTKLERISEERSSDIIPWRDECWKQSSAMMAGSASAFPNLVLSVCFGLQLPSVSVTRAKGQIGEGCCTPTSLLFWDEPMPRQVYVCIISEVEMKTHKLECSMFFLKNRDCFKTEGNWNVGPLLLLQFMTAGPSIPWKWRQGRGVLKKNADLDPTSFRFSLPAFLSSSTEFCLHCKILPVCKTPVELIYL